MYNMVARLGKVGGRAQRSSGRAHIFPTTRNGMYIYMRLRSRNLKESSCLSNRESAARYSSMSSLTASLMRLSTEKSSEDVEVF